MNETIKNNLKKMYEKYGATFKDLSFSTEHNKSCVKSELKAISGDNLKTNCCKKYLGIESVDAISFNKTKMKFIFIEFKIKQINNLREPDRFDALIKDLKNKFDDSWGCFQHNIDTYRILLQTTIKKVFVYKLRNKLRNSRIEFQPLKKELEKYDIDMEPSEIFEKNDKDYEYSI